MPGLSVGALALMRGEEPFNAPERALPPTWALALATGTSPLLKPNESSLSFAGLKSSSPC